MRSLRLWVVGVILLSLSCGGGPPQPRPLSSTWVAPAILSHIPADSPYVVASLEHASEKIRQRLLRGLDGQLAEIMRALDRARGPEGSPLEPWIRAALAVAEELRGKDPASWGRELGFDPDGRFAIYGLSIWPVVRIELANPARLRTVIERALAAAGIQLKQATLDGHPYWIAGSSRFTVVAAVLDREAVVAILPTSSLAAALPLVLGTKNPPQNLGTTTKVPDLLGRHHLLGFVLAYLDARNAVDIVTGQQPSELDAPLHALTGPISPACRADLDRLVAIAPRFVSGYRRLDDAGFEVVGVLETPASVAHALGKLRAAVPELTAQSAAHPLVAFGAAIDPDELVAWLRGVTTQLHEHPFACPWLSGINDARDRLAHKLTAPLPPMLRGLRGFSVVVDQATITPLDVEGHLLIAGVHIADLMSALAGQVPALAGIPVKPDGRPVALSLQQLGIPIHSAHIAMTSDRLVVATGANSGQRATDHIASPVPRSSPLFMMAFDAPRLQKLMTFLGRSDFNNIGYLGNVGIAFDAADDGLSFDVWGSWNETPAPPPPGQPLTQP